ncbi:hypothetical protein EV424DRAFT_1541423 [Suillus variegatus]|nr:hypothetical protein EV424DRAFT_1541423 [Suillus variegatus]
MSKHAEHQANAKEAEHRMASTTQSYLQSCLDHGKPVVNMKNVNVSYDPHKVLKNINWTIRAGTFKNGSGKTTLSLLTVDHPQSYTQQGDSNLGLFVLSASAAYPYSTLMFAYCHSFTPFIATVPILVVYARAQGLASANVRHLPPSR